MELEVAQTEYAKLSQKDHKDKVGEHIRYLKREIAKLNT
jgi:hypothetical protein